MEFSDHKFVLENGKLRTVYKLYTGAINSDHAAWDAYTSDTAISVCGQFSSAVFWQWFQTTRLLDFCLIKIKNKFSAHHFTNCTCFQPQVGVR
jgi:hypothetical protein